MATEPTLSKILIIDSGVATRTEIESLLTPYHCEILSSSSEHDSLEHIHASELDLVLLNMELENEAMLDLLRQVRNDLNKRDLPLILLAEHPRREMVTRAIEVGVSAFLTKPFSEESFLQRIQQFITLRYRSAKQKDKAPQAQMPKRPLEHEKTVLIFDLDAERRDLLIRLLRPTQWHLNFMESLDEISNYIGANTFDYLLISADTCALENNFKDWLEVHHLNLETHQIIGLSNAENTDALLLMRELGINHFILDPISHSKLEKMAHSLLGDHTELQ